MDRGEFLRLSALAGAGGVLGVPLTSFTEWEPPVRSNFIVVMADDLNVGALQDLPWADTLLESEGTKFNRSFCTTAVCAPSRASFLTGQYVHNHGMTNNDTAFDEMREEGLHEDNVVGWLHDGGYRTSMIGKYVNNYEAAVYVPPVWDEWYATLGQNRDMLVSNNGVEEELTQNSTREFSERAVEFVTRMATEPDPYFLMLGLGIPHDPPEIEAQYEDSFSNVNAPRGMNFNRGGQRAVPWRQRVDKLSEGQIEDIDQDYRQYLRTMLSCRDLLVDLIAALNTTDTFDNTYLIFTSDNGYHFGNHKMPPGKMTPYEEDIKIPLIWRGADVVPDATRSEMVANIDLAPTLLDLAGLPPRTSVDGRSYAPMLRGESIPEWRQYLGIENWRYESDNPGIPNNPTYYGVRTPTHKLVEYADGSREWFRVDTDFREVDNKPPRDNPEVFRNLCAKANQIRENYGDGVRMAESP